MKQVGNALSQCRIDSNRLVTKLRECCTYVLCCLSGNGHIVVSCGVVRSVDGWCQLILIFWISGNSR